MIALVGTDAQFHCAGTGNYLNWVIDELVMGDSTIRDRGVSAVTHEVSGVIQSNLTVPATLENNATSVQCVITSLTSVPVHSDHATLTVLPGMCHPYKQVIIILPVDPQGLPTHMHDC